VSTLTLGNARIEPNVVNVYYIILYSFYWACPLESFKNPHNIIQAEEWNLNKEAVKQKRFGRFRPSGHGVGVKKNASAIDVSM
jgi:hypothetical protein